MQVVVATIIIFRFYVPFQDLSRWSNKSSVCECRWNGCDVNPLSAPQPRNTAYHADSAHMLWKDILQALRKSMLYTKYKNISKCQIKKFLKGKLRIPH